MRRRTLALFAGLFAGQVACMTAASAGAGSLRVSPVLFEMSPARPTATLTLHNEGDQPLTVQIRVFQWRNGPRGDTLVPATEVVASPPFSSLAAGSEQTVRLVRTDGAPVTGEQAYRLLVDELPAPDRSDGQTVMLLMRHSIPVFVEGPALSRPDVAWTVTADDGGYRICAANRGQRRQRMSELRLYDDAGRVVAEQAGLLGYVLGGSSVEWRLPFKNGPGEAPVKLGVETDLGHQDVAVSRAAP